MLATNNFTRQFATIYVIETFLSSRAILIIETRNAIISISKLKIVALYFLINLLRSTMLALLARMQLIILLSINQMRQSILIELLIN